MHGNIEIVRGIYDALHRGDLDAVAASFADDCEIELIGPSSIPFAGRYRGPRGMRQFLEAFLGSAELLEFTPDELHGADDLVTVLAHERARARQTGREWSTRVVDTFKLRDGKIRDFLCAYDTASVASAFGEPR